MTTAVLQQLPRQQLRDFCHKRHIRKLALFGSALRADFSPASDLDVLVEFEPGHIPGLAFFEIEAELTELLGYPVDLNTPRFLSAAFRDEVLASAEVVYDETCPVCDRLIGKGDRSYQ